MRIYPLPTQEKQEEWNVHATAHSPTHYKPMACADLDEVTVHQKKVSGKHM